MKKNGNYFVSLVDENQYKPSVWDPYLYRDTGNGFVLSQFISVRRAGVKTLKSAHTPFRPIEYRDILGGEYLSFTLEKTHPSTPQFMVEENTLLFGTMRAYLGNIVVTPLAEWIDETPPLCFGVKSEFFTVYPFDELHYFWLVYFRSKKFRNSLPIGSGGTRPRLTIDGFVQTPVVVPDLVSRREIHEKIKELAATEWRTRTEVIKTLGSVIE